MVKVSVIMPSLNVFNYISACMDSVINQTLQDIEIIVVDAGSTDGTLEILQQYADRDSRICLIHSEMKSYGHQVNLGISLAKGEYIGIVETDDYICDDMYEYLYQKAKQYDLQYVKTSFQKFVESQSGVSRYQFGGYLLKDNSLLEKIINPQEHPELATSDFYLWAGIYRREFVQNIKLSETPGAAFQDIGFIFQVLMGSTKAMYTKKEAYYYRQTKTNSSMNRNGFFYLIQEFNNINKYVLANKTWQQGYYERLVSHIWGRFQNMALGRAYWEEKESDIIKLTQLLQQAEKAGVFIPDKMNDEFQKIHMLLLISPKKLFEYAKENIISLISYLDEVEQKIGQDKVVIFGCAKTGKYLLELFENRKAGSVVAMCDNKSELQGTQIQTMTVISPKEATVQYSNAKYITTSPKYAEQMKNQLAELGITEDRILDIQPMYDFRLLLVTDAKSSRNIFDE